MAVQIAILIACCALPGLVLRRGGPWPARLAVVLAFAAIGLAVLDLPREILTPIPSRVVVVPTAGLDADRTKALATRFPGAIVNVAAGTDRLAHRLARSRLRHAEEPALVLMWTGRFSTEGPRGLRQPAAVLADHDAVPLDPDDVEVRLVRAPVAGRPGGLEVLIGGDRVPGLTGRLWIVDGAAEPAVERTFDNDPITRIDWMPTRAGRHQVHLTLSVAGVSYRGSGPVEVVAASVVTLVGRQAAEVGKVLAVQGIDPRPMPTLPARLDPQQTGTLVLLDPLDAAGQERVRRFVEDGGGLFLVGGEQGGGVPGQQEPLAALSPVVRLPLRKTDPRDGTGDGDRRPGEDPKVSDPNTATEDPPKPPPEKDNKDAATGDTSKAKLTDDEREVKRRVIAMVLLVDRSGSMGLPLKSGVSCMDAAKASALQSALALDEQDLLGVVSFGNKDAAQVVLPMTSVREAKRIKSALESLRAQNEGTFVRGGLDQARVLLDAVRASIKCVVVVTDGFFHDLADGVTTSSARAYQDSKVSLQIIQLLSKDPDPAPDSAVRLQTLAKLGRGRVIAQESVDKVPKLVITEVQRLRTEVGRPKRRDLPGASPGADPTGKQPPDPVPKPPRDQPKPPRDQPRVEPQPPDLRLPVRVIEDSGLLEPQPGDGFPPVGGVLPVAGRPGTRILLAAGADGIPLLAFANRGLGRVGVWTSDFFGPWGRWWAADPTFPGRLSQWVQSLAPPAGRLAQARVLHRPDVVPELPLPSEAEYLEALGGSALRPVETFVIPSPGIRTQVRGRAAGHAWYGLLFLVLLAGVEFLAVRRRWRRG